MLKFTNEQKACKIGNIEVGGSLGERPTVLIGSIFFRGHNIVTNAEEGIFDKQKAKDLLDREGEASALTGNPRIIDVVSDTTQAAIKYTEFVAANCDAPILVDSSVAKVRMETIRHFANTEIAPRLVYNSIDPHHTEEELNCIKECGIKSAVILAFSTKALKPKGRLKLLNEDLLEAAQRAGVENMLVDTGVLDIPSVSWSTQAIWEVKEELGLPSGCAPANAVYQWEKMRSSGSPVFEAAATPTFIYPISQGADFILYGPIRNARWVYPACAAMDAIIAYGAMLNNTRPGKEHPLYKIF